MMCFTMSVEEGERDTSNAFVKWWLHDAMQHGR